MPDEVGEFPVPMWGSTSCPWCARPNNAAAAIGDEHRAPKDGDWSVCWGCRQPSVWAGVGWRKPTATEDDEIRRSPEWRAAQAALTESFLPREAIGLLRSDDER